MALVTEAEQIVGTSESSPATDIFRTLVSTCKSNVEDFMLRAEQRYKELDTLVHVYSFCDKVCVFHSFDIFSVCHFVVFHLLPLVYILYTHTDLCYT